MEKQDCKCKGKGTCQCDTKVDIARKRMLIPILGYIYVIRLCFEDSEELFYTITTMKFVHFVFIQGTTFWIMLSLLFKILT